MKAAQLYARTQTQTASKERTLVLLFQTAARHMRTGAASLSAGKRPEATVSFGKATDIVAELQRTLDPNRAPQLAEMLLPLYEYVLLRLSRAITHGDGNAALEALRAFTPIVEAFESAVANMGVPGKAG